MFALLKTGSNKYQFAVSDADFKLRKEEFRCLKLAQQILGEVILYKFVPCRSLINQLVTLQLRS
jgi:hypothetical protein